MRIFLLVLLTLLPSSVFAADLGYGGTSGQCVSYRESNLASQSLEQIEFVIYQNFELAKAATQSSAVIGSKSVAFNWANASRIWCGNAIGFFESDIVDEISIGKCDCFYRRYTSFR